MRRIWQLVAVLALAACDATAGSPAPSDSAFSALQQRGAAPEAMGVDQYAALHQFDDLPDGGRIELQYANDSTAAVQQIRAHLQHIAGAFAQGDFRIPGFVHEMADMPGTRVMTEKRAVIRYEYGELPRGGAVRIRSDDAEAVKAIHEFLEVQRHDHRAGGHSM